MTGLAQLCGSVLERNWIEGERDGVPFAYTRPSPGRYPWQWYWDSCFTAIAWRRFDPARSAAELRTLLAAAREGFIGHVIFWDRQVTLRRRLYYNVRSRSAPMTGTIQPPLLAWAWAITVGDPRSEPGIRAHHRWLSAHRDLDGDGLLWLVQPDESGLDSSPKFDPVWGWRSHARHGFPLLVRRGRRVGWDARRRLAAGGPVLCEVLTNVLWGLSRLAMGEPSITPALVDRLWDSERGLFADEARPGGRITVNTWSALAPLALPDLPAPIGRRLIREHLLDPREYRLPFPPPSVSASEASFAPGRGRGIRRRYWRGPTWVNAAWLLWLGLMRLGHDREAEQMGAALGSAVADQGLREYYNPYTGEGLGAREFAWTSLVCEMTEPDPEAARRSYL